MNREYAINHILRLRDSDTLENLVRHVRMYHYPNLNQKDIEESRAIIIKIKELKIK